jgi:drug/metabolite transporter (DMT)-like permease
MSRRPAAIIWCECLVLVALVMRVATAVWGDGSARIAVVDAQIGPGVGAVVLVAGIVAPAALAFWATRRANRAAAWFFTVWVGLLAAGFAASLALGQIRFGPISSVSLAILAFYTAAVFLLFTRAARRWLRGERTAAEIAAEFS